MKKFAKQQKEVEYYTRTQGFYWSINLCKQRKHTLAFDESRNNLASTSFVNETTLESVYVTNYFDLLLIWLDVRHAKSQITDSIWNCRNMERRRSFCYENVERWERKEINLCRDDRRIVFFTGKQVQQRQRDAT